MHFPLNEKTVNKYLLEWKGAELQLPAFYITEVTDSETYLSCHLS